ncbi:MAG: MBG domain-containing protein, partial [Erythrobacter sp.]
RLNAEARGGENAGGTGGLALGGRASTATFGNGLIRIGSFSADTLAQGGNGRIGGNGVGGIAGAIAQFGQVAITGNAFAGSEGVGGNATYGAGGNGGFGRGGNSFFQANGDLTRTARITIGGDAVAFAQGVGGNGGNGDSVTAGGAGGAGLGGGQGNVPNQADPAFGSGAFLLAGGDNGTIEIGGEAVAVATAAGGRGGNGGSGTAGGNGGNALSGLAQAGLALLGNNGSLGLGVARFGTVLAQTDAFAGNGGTASDPAQNGAGGIGIAGTSALTARAGDVFATAVELSAIGFGGNGSTGGNGSGGFAGVLGSFAGSLSLSSLSAISQGFGGASNGAGNGGTGTGGNASLDFSLMDTTISGDVLIDASGFGGSSVSGRGGDGIGLNARIGTLGTGAGNGTIGGNTRVLANGTGGAGATAGSGDGGLAEAQAFNGGTSNFASLLLSANGRFGEAGAGVTALRTANGSTSTLNATSVQMTANATDGTTNFAGQFLVNAESGNINLGSLTASSLGNALNVDLSSSRLLAEFGNINVTGALTAATYGDMLLRIGTNSVIGNTATTGNNTNIQLDASGTIRLLAVAPPSGPGSANDPIGTGGIVGRNITMRAGRSILLDGNLTSRSGAVSLAANLGGGPALATPQPSVITMGSGFSIHAGTGQVAINLADGAGDPQRATGAITLANVTGGSIAVDNRGSSAGSNIVVLSNGVLTASGTGRAIDLASFNGEVINFANDAGLVLTGGGHFGIFAATPTGSQIGNPANYVRRYNVQTEAAYDALNPGGNFAAFRIAPVITVTANNASRFYGSANPLFTASFVGFLPGDGVANLSGAASLTTTATVTSNVGTFAIAAALGTLASDQGYQFVFNPGVLTITQRPITVTANNISRLYGNANPALTFTVGGQGLVNGDQLTGALATTATATTGVGTVAITQGTLAATNNYILTFVNGQLSITPRLLTVTANNQSILLGQPDPELTFTLTGDGLVNGDLLAGALVRDEGNAIGTYAIRQGTLRAGDNYTITYVGGTFDINAPPAPPALTSPALIEAPFLASEEPPMSSEEEEERFGMDFPERPDAPLITQESLLDDPVSSGGDASLYSGDANAAPGGGEKK